MAKLYGTYTVTRNVFGVDFAIQVAGSLTGLVANGTLYADVVNRGEERIVLDNGPFTIVKELFQKLSHYTAGRGQYGVGTVIEARGKVLLTKEEAAQIRAREKTIRDEGIQRTELEKQIRELNNQLADLKKEFEDKQKEIRKNLDPLTDERTKLARNLDTPVQLTV